MNKYWLAFLGVLGICSFGYTGITFYRLYNYLILSAQAPARDFVWSTQEIGSENFAIRVEYTFDSKGKSVRTQSLFQPEKMINPWAAEQVIKKYQNRKMAIWYNPSHPNHSTLQKKFPIKECISTFLLWALLLYFVGLGYYVKQYDRN